MSFAGWVDTTEGWVLLDETGEPKKRLPLGVRPPENELDEPERCYVCQTQRRATYTADNLQFHREHG